MISSLLIANRGEIAIRILKTARRLGIKTYCFQTPQEANAVYLKWTDEIILISENSTNQSIFLDAEMIIKYAKNLNIEAIHPGYGFLSENKLLPQLCEKNNIVFIGPNASLIEQMGDKNKARQIAISAGLNVAEGTSSPILDLPGATEASNKIGYPVILKALAGGGGKGMRIVYSSNELPSAYKMAVNEAGNAFNNTALIIEKYIENPRHIEIQILADKHGNAIHLFERECSIQRNHQKLLEEAPSLALKNDLREKMTKDALALVHKTGYYTLGTIEFLLDNNNQYYFMEMNTRIQVEHPVTEAITGIDLVEHQIRTAYGDHLQLKQKDIKCNGWAIEYRVNAEDVQSGFCPNFGIIEEMNFPAYPGLRVDSGFIPGSKIPTIYDSLITKIIISGKDRKTVIKRSKDVMNRSRIKGIKTTIPLFKAILNDHNFIEGHYTTSFISNMDQHHYQEENEEEAAALIALQYYLDEIKQIQHGKMEMDSSTPWINNMLHKIF